MEPRPATLIDELKRRRVFRAVGGYGLVSFGLLQVVEPVMHALHLPDETLTYVVLALAAGFPLLVVLAWAFDLNEGRLERTAAPAAVSTRAARPWLALVLLGLVAAAPGTAWFFLARRAPLRPARTGQPASDEALKAALDAVPPASELRSPPSIAVLPFADMSAAKDQEYFSDGVAEEILDALAQVEGLRVIGRTSSFSFKGKTEDLRAIGGKLQVGHLLEGSVRKAGNRVRVTAQLIETAGGSHLWSQTFERELTDLFVVQEEIARATVSALKVTLHLPAAAVPKERNAASPEAYNQFLLGRQFFSRGNLADYERAQQAFQKAVDLDPTYAAAWAGLAHARYWVADSGATIAAIAAGQEQARAAADRAVALRPDLPDGYLARGWRAVAQWDLAGARGAGAGARDQPRRGHRGDLPGPPSDPRGAPGGDAGARPPAFL